MLIEKFISISVASILFIKKLCFIIIQLSIPNINVNAKWIHNGISMAGGNGQGNELNQLSYPSGVYVDDDETIYVADRHNHRIVEWKNGATSGQVIAGRNGQENKNDQLNEPRGIIIDKENDCLIICDGGNKRIVRWPRRNGISGETIISKVNCRDLTMDNDGYIYVSDIGKHEVRRWKMGDTNGTLVAGGNGQGNCLNQLNGLRYIFVDQDHSIYISDYGNDRVMKWMKGTKEGIVVAGGQGEGNGLTQLSYPYGVIVDQLGTVYVVDCSSQRVMRWLKGGTQCSVVVDGNGPGGLANQFNGSMDLSFDRQNNLYIVDLNNYRVQKFDIDSI
jgi:sugar lactone lactonase YvrE